MKILVIVPITGVKKAELDERIAYYRSLVRPETKVEYVQVKEGPPAVESQVNHAQVAAEVLKYVKKAEEDGYDAIIINCGGDPGVEAARTMVDIPIIGPGEAMRLLSSTLGKKICGVMPRLPVLDIRKDMKKTIALIKKDIEEKIKKGFDSFYLVCLAMWGLGKILRDETGLPVIDGAEASLKMAEVLVDLKLKPSRIAYPKYPPPHRS